MLLKVVITKYIINKTLLYLYYYSSRYIEVVVSIYYLVLST